MLVHLSVAYAYPGLRYQVPDMVSQLIDTSNPVIYYKDLTAPVQFSGDNLPYHGVLLFKDIGLHRISLLRRFFDDTHILNTGQRHVKGSWNRCGRQSQNIYILLHLLNFLLVSNAKTLLLIYHQKAQLLKFHIL